jgi:HD superfamily phosphodiesterase
MWFVFMNKEIIEGCPWQLTFDDKEPDDVYYEEFTNEEQAKTFLQYKKNLSYAREENRIFNGEIFIMPYPAKRYTSFDVTYQKHLENFCKLNGIECNLDSIWIEVWGSFEGNNSAENNFAAHGVLLDNGKEYSGFPQFLPYKLIENINEGEILSFLVELNDRSHDFLRPNSEGIDYEKTIFEVELKTSQKKSRYARFGFFEHAVRYVLKGLKKNKKKMQNLINEILSLAITYNGNDVKRINHLLKVFSFARLIGKLEKCESQIQTIIEISAILHDIGIHEAERKHNSIDGNWQEIEGPIVAQELLKDCNLDKNILNRVLFLIGHHHTYKAIDGKDFQILVEADFLVNIFEDEIEISECEKIKENIFKTKTGIGFLEQFYFNC